MIILYINCLVCVSVWHDNYAAILWQNRAMHYVCLWRGSALRPTGPSVGGGGKRGTSVRLSMTGPGGRGMGGRAGDPDRDSWTRPTKKRVVHVEKVDPVNYPVSGRASEARLDRCLRRGLGSGSGWTGRGWPGKGPGPWSMNTADEEMGSPRRKGEPDQLSSVRKGKWSRGNKGWNGRAADGTALDTGVVSLLFYFILFYFLFLLLRKLTGCLIHPILCT
jgi:hypothetical protein